MKELIERLEAEAKGNPYLSAFADRIIAKANEDATYAEKAKSAKLADVFKYVKGKAEKKAKDGVAMIRDETVYAWVDEAVLNGTAEPKGEEIDIEAKCEETRKPMPEPQQKPVKKPKKKDEAKWEQYSLFDFPNE